MDGSKSRRFAAARNTRRAAVALAGMFVLALVASAPASAAWLKTSTGKSLVEEVSPRSLSGSLNFEDPLGGAECSAAGSLRLDPGDTSATTASLKTLALSCQLGYIYEGFECKATSATVNTPLQMTASGSSLKIKNLELAIHTSSGCSLGNTIPIECPEFVTTANSTSLLSKLTISNKACVVFPDEEYAYEAVPKGSLTVSPAEYGFGTPGPEWGKETKTKAYYNGVAIKGTENETYTGMMSFSSEAGGFSCQAAVGMKMKFGNAQINSLSLSSCSNGPFHLFECEATAQVTGGFPWPVTYTDITKVGIDGVTINALMKPGCTLGANVPIATADTIGAYLKKMGSLNVLELYGAVEGAWPWTVSGTLTAAQQNVHTLVE
jgi:hypothetical protein